MGCIGIQFNLIRDIFIALTVALSTKRYWKVWRLFTVRQRKLRIKFATHIRNANKMLPSAAAQASEVWIGEWLGIVVQMWRR